MNIAGAVKDYIERELAPDRAEQPLGLSEDLIKGGVLDSMGILSVVNFLETTYGISVLDNDLVPDHFATLERIERFVTEKRSEASS